MTWKAYDAIKWAEGMRIKTVDGIEVNVIYRCAGAYNDLLAVETADRSFTLSFRDIAEVL